MTEKKILNPLKAIRQNCKDCMGGVANPGNTVLVRECSTRDCPLWPYRFGMGYRAALKQGKDVDPNAK